MTSAAGPYTAGVDIGAAQAKVAVIAADGQLVGWSIARSGTDFAGSATRGYDVALGNAGLSERDVARVFSCGYGRKNVPFAHDSRTEIAAHAAGAYHHFPQALTIIDIGGQDNKIIKVNKDGIRTGFKMNRKCAAGTGAFLEEMALRLDLPLEELDNMAASAEKEASLGAFCTVFTATEVLAKIREGVPVENLVKGLFASVVKRVKEMDLVAGLVVMTGGVAAHNPFLVKMLSEDLGVEVKTPPHPQLTGAWGAALLARKDLLPEAA